MRSSSAPCSSSKATKLERFGTLVKLFPPASVPQGDADIELFEDVHHRGNGAGVLERGLAGSSFGESDTALHLGLRAILAT